MDFVKILQTELSSTQCNKKKFHCLAGKDWKCMSLHNHSLAVAKYQLMHLFLKIMDRNQSWTITAVPASFPFFLPLDESKGSTHRNQQKFCTNTNMQDFRLVYFK